MRYFCGVLFGCSRQNKGLSYTAFLETESARTVIRDCPGGSPMPARDAGERSRERGR